MKFLNSFCLRFLHCPGSGCLQPQKCDFVVQHGSTVFPHKCCMWMRYDAIISENLPKCVLKKWGAQTKILYSSEVEKLDFFLNGFTGLPWDLWDLWDLCQRRALHLFDGQWIRCTNSPRTEEGVLWRCLDDRDERYESGSRF